ncbi:MAG: excinuclease ABC subunit UvrB [Phycisphaerae bacterium]|nr:excinuclease ABC subunit UvrB [Phycisphaerae bacterium]
MPHEPRPFQVVAPFAPAGDQPRAIEEIVSAFESGRRAACLLGATGTGKTFTMAHVIARLGKPTLIMSHNKTLAAQLYEELREFFPHNSVNYFVSYYDYYQPEAYIPQRDIYIEKDSNRNDDLDKLRLAATSSILSRRDTIVVASVSCIFGLGSPEAYGDRVLTLARGSPIDRRGVLLALNAMQYKRSDIEFTRGMFRVRGDVLDVFPAYEQFAVRIELFGDEIERLHLINPVSGEVIAEETAFHLFPANHYVVPDEQLAASLKAIRDELDARLVELRGQGKLLEAHRLQARTRYDLEMMQEVGYCSGVENYSRHFDGRPPGEKPYTLMDYFDFAPPEADRAGRPELDRHARPPAADAPEGQRATRPRRNFRDWLVIIDESHVSVPQVRAMFNGDRARKLVLVEHGFRLPSALDNRPLRFEEFEAMLPRTLYVSATPGPYELAKVGGVVAQQIIRPTGLLDPTIEIRPAARQVADLLERCIERAGKDQRVLVTALTKRLCEDLTLHLHENGLRVRYLHSDIDAIQRMEILTDLRKGAFDVLVGVNLLREGLDLPEVSLVCVLDADKEGFLRSATSLIQQIGRAARNVDAHVVMYADKVTPSMAAAIEETERRRDAQTAYNRAHGITPQTIRKAIRRGMEQELAARRAVREAARTSEPAFDRDELVRTLEAEMLEAAEKLDFETAARLRDQARALRTNPRFRDGPESIDARVGRKVRRSELDAPGVADASDRRAGMPGVRAKQKRKPKPGSGR